MVRKLTALPKSPHDLIGWGKTAYRSGRVPWRWILVRARCQGAADSLLQVSGRSAEGSIVAVLLVQIRCDHVANYTCDSQRTDDGKHGIYKQFKTIHTQTPLIRALPRLSASDLIPNLLCDGLATDRGGFLPQVGSGTDVRISFPDTQIPEFVGDVFPRF